MTTKILIELIPYPPKSAIALPLRNDLLHAEPDSWFGLVVRAKDLDPPETPVQGLIQTQKIWYLAST